MMPVNLKTSSAARWAGPAPLWPSIARGVQQTAHNPHGRRFLVRHYGEGREQTGNDDHIIVGVKRDAVFCRAATNPQIMSSLR